MPINDMSSIRFAKWTNRIKRNLTHFHIPPAQQLQTLLGEAKHYFKGQLLGWSRLPLFIEPKDLLP